MLPSISKTVGQRPSAGAGSKTLRSKAGTFSSPSERDRGFGDVEPEGGDSSFGERPHEPARPTPHIEDGPTAPIDHEFIDLIGRRQPARDLEFEPVPRVGDQGQPTTVVEGLFVRGERAGNHQPHRHRAPQNRPQAWPRMPLMARRLRPRRRRRTYRHRSTRRAFAPASPPPAAGPAGFLRYRTSTSAPR